MSKIEARIAQLGLVLPPRFSDLLTEVFGPDLGGHARSAVGQAALPFGIPVEIEAVVHL